MDDLDNQEKVTKWAEVSGKINGTVLDSPVGLSIDMVGFGLTYSVDLIVSRPVS